MVHFSALCAPQWPSQSAFRQCSQAQFHHWLYFDLIFMFQPESRLEVTIVLTNTVPFGPNGCSFGLNSSISHLTVFSYELFLLWLSQLLCLLCSSLFPCMKELFSVFQYGQCVLSRQLVFSGDGSTSKSTALSVFSVFCLIWWSPILVGKFPLTCQPGFLGPVFQKQEMSLLKIQQTWNLLNWTKLKIQKQLFLFLIILKWKTY